MRRAPRFWSKDGNQTIPRLLDPLTALTAAATARRVSRPGWRAPVPVICCGNVTVGGSGKTTLALDIGKRLIRRGLDPHFLLRGYGGSARDARLVRVGDSASVTGDEALLLAEMAPTWTGADRASSARAAIGNGAHVLIMDDGLQNPTLKKDLSLLIVDGGFGFGNGRLIPAGPLRESVAAGAGRCQAAIIIGDDLSGAERQLPCGLARLRARLVPGPDAAALSGVYVYAFAGIGRPGKFFATLAELKVTFARQMTFPDHHLYDERELDSMFSEAERLGALPVTTAKDAVRIPAKFQDRFRTLAIELAWEDCQDIDKLLLQYVSKQIGE